MNKKNTEAVYASEKGMNNQKLIIIISIIILLIAGIIYTIFNVVHKKSNDTTKSNSMVSTNIDDNANKSNLESKVSQNKGDAVNYDNSEDKSSDSKDLEDDTNDSGFETNASMDVEDAPITPELEPKTIVSSYLNNVRKLEVSKAGNYTVNNVSGFENVKDQINSKDTSKAHYNTFFKKMMDYSYRIDDTKIDGDKASVEITLKTYNFTTKVIDARLHISDATLAAEFSGDKNVDEEKIAQEELSKILDPLKRKLEIPVKLTLTKTENGWRIDNESISGTLNTAIKANLIDSINYYTEFYEEPNKPDGTISVSSFIKYLKSKGIEYDENSKQSPFDQVNK